MNRIQPLLEIIKANMQQYVDNIMSHIAHATSTDFMQLSLVQHVVKAFTAVLSACATCYELARYVASLSFVVA